MSLIPEPVRMLSTDPRIQRWYVSPGGFIAFFALHAAMLELGNVLYLTADSVAPAWPASALLLTALCVSSYRLWGRVLVAVLLAQLCVDVLVHDRDLTLSLCSGFANMIEGIAGAMIVQYFCGTSVRPSRLRDVLVIGFGAGVLACAVGGLIGASGLHLSGVVDDYWFAFRAWWFADAVGVIVLTAPLLSMVRFATEEHSPADSSRTLEGVVLFVLLVPVSQIALGSGVVEVLSGVELLYPLFTLLAWAALRFTPLVTSVALLTMVAFALANVIVGAGPFNALYLDSVQRVLSLQAFLVFVSLTVFIANAVASEWVQARKEVADRESLLLAFLNHSPQMIAIRSVDGHFLHLNRSYCERRQIREQDHIGKDIDSLQPAEKVEHFEAKHKEVIEQLSVVESEDELWMPEGPIQVHSVRFPILDARGQCIALGVISTDVTQLHQTRQGLQASEDRFRSALEAAGSGGWDIDVTKGQVWLSESARNLVGAFNPGPILLDDYLHDYIHVDDRSRLLNAYVDLLKGNVPLLQCEWRTLDRNGRYVWILGRGTVVERDETGFARRVVGASVDISELKRVQSSQAESEARLHAFMDYSPDAISIKDAEGRYLFINRRLEESLGHSNEEVFGKPSVDYPGISTADAIEAVDEEVRSSRRVVSRDIERVENGELKAWRVDHFPILNANGELMGTGSIRSDVSERRRAERQLEERARFNAMLSTVSGLFLAVDAHDVERGMTDALRAVAEHFEVERAGIIQRVPNTRRVLAVHRWSADASSEDVEAWEKIVPEESPWLAVRIGQRQPVVINRVADLPDDAQTERVWFERLGLQSLLWVPMVYADDLLGYLGLVAVGEARHWDEEHIRSLALAGELFANAMVRFRTRQALIDSEDQFRDLVEGSIQGIFVHNKDSILFANAACASIFGYESAAAFSSIDDRFVLYSESDRENLRALGLQRLNGEPVTGEYEFDARRRDGSEIRLHSLSRLVEWKGEAAIQVVVVDVTQRHEAELALQRANADLESKVLERTAELEAANEQLQQLDQLKTMFIASMSHELRTPLNAIIGFTGVVLGGMAGELNAEQHSQLTRVQGAGRHLLSLITDVIDVSKIEAGHVDVFPVVVQVGNVIAQACEQLRTQIEDKQLVLRVNAADDIEAFTDHKRLLQCLINLVSNAAKYSERGSIVVALDEVGDDVRISVADTGIGIEKQQLSRLFQPFERLDSHLRVSTPGTGLGLYVTHKLARDVLHGTLTVTSEPGLGSTFILQFPKRAPTGESIRPH